MPPQELRHAPGNVKARARRQAGDGEEAAGASMRLLTGAWGTREVGCLQLELEGASGGSICSLCSVQLMGQKSSELELLPLADVMLYRGDAAVPSFHVPGLVMAAHEQGCERPVHTEAKIHSLGKS